MRRRDDWTRGFLNRVAMAGFDDVEVEFADHGAAAAGKRRVDSAG